MLSSWQVCSDDQDINRFKVLLVYANSPMDNLMPVSVSSLAGALKRRGFSVRLFDTTFYAGTGTGADEVDGERRGSLQVAEFDYNEVGIKYIESDVFEDFRSFVKQTRPNLIALNSVEPTHDLGLKLLEHVDDLNVPTIVGGVHTIFSPEDIS